MRARMPGDDLGKARDLDGRIEQRQALHLRNQPPRHHGDQVARAQDLGQDQETAHGQGHPARPAEPGQRFIRHARETAPTYDTSA